MPFDTFVPSVIDRLALEYDGEKESNAYAYTGNSKGV